MWTLVVTTLLLTGEMHTSHTPFTNQKKCLGARDFVIADDRIATETDSFLGIKIFGDCVRIDQ